jgi:hypothetical protein
MSCPSSELGSQVEFSGEMVLHFTGLKNVDNPGVWLFPKVLVCLDCGFARFTIPEAELALLAAGVSTRVQLAKEASVDDTQPPRSR